jgi:4-hydroxy-tetrahydrodipicolinate synthase
MFDMLSGTYTAIVTPFRADGSVDYDTFRTLVDNQIEAGVDGVVPMGTTGESPTLTVEEHAQVIRTAIEVAEDKIKVIAGTGANSTQEAVELTRRARDAGAHASLQVTPYYNKPSQEGLYRHFAAVADLGLPVVLYNVPGRTSRQIDVDTIVRLAEHPHVTAVKEAGGCVDRVSEIVNRCGITVLSGDDALTLPMMAVGARGVISVASNVAPEGVTALVNSAINGDWEDARVTHNRYYRLFRGLFLDTNPVPVKAALAMMGQIEEIYRLPLCAMAHEEKQQLREILAELELLEEASS